MNKSLYESLLSLFELTDDAFMDLERHNDWSDSPDESFKEKYNTYFKLRDKIINEVEELWFLNGQKLI